MEFALSEDQRLLQDSLRSVLGRTASLDSIRSIASGDQGGAATLGEALLDFGLPALPVPIAAGGLGLGCLEACLVQEVLGAHVAPSGFLAGCVAADVLADRPDMLEDLASGRMRIALAFTELASRRDGAGIVLSGGYLSGKSLLAQSVAGATHLLLADTQGMLHCVDAALCQPQLMQTIDRTRVFHEISLEGAQALLSVPFRDSILARARLLIAADTLGAAQAMLDRAVAYARDRHQFGRAIGSFQAVKHMCAEMAAKLEPARALVWHAAHAFDIGENEAPVMASLAKAHLSEVGTFVARTATEVHGGMGFTDLCGLHFWFKRIGVNRQLLGSPEQARETAARLQGLVATSG